MIALILEQLLSQNREEEAEEEREIRERERDGGELMWESVREA